MSGVNRPYRSLRCTQACGAVSGAVFWGAITTGDAALNLMRGRPVVAAQRAASIPLVVVLGAAAGALGWAPTWSPESLWETARAVALRFNNKVA